MLCLPQRCARCQQQMWGLAGRAAAAAAGSPSRREGPPPGAACRGRQ
jgi:hypothetical protein